jgi:hypothetical protein
VFAALFFAKMLSKVIPLYPTVKAFDYKKEEGLYFTLMMSTGLTFGTISALFGLNHGVITQAQYSHLVATVIGSAVIPTMIANAWFMPRHLLAKGQRKSRFTSTCHPKTQTRREHDGKTTERAFSEAAGGLRRVSAVGKSSGCGLLVGRVSGCDGADLCGCYGPRNRRLRSN